MTCVEDIIGQVSDDLGRAYSLIRGDEDPRHEDFYEWGWALSTLSSDLARISELLARKLGPFEENWTVRDDEGTDPHERLDRCRHLLTVFSASLDAADRIAQDYHNEMGHVGVEPRRGQ